MALGSGVEVELAVAKGEAYLYKVRFRPSSILTVGTNPMTAITLDGDGVPAFLEFLNITSEGVLLRFTPDIRVEVLSGSEVLATQGLISGGYANRAGDAYGVELESGSKAVVRLGGHKLMIKVDVPTDQEVLMVNAPSEGEAACGRCGTRLRLVLAGGGALTPCAACGALNRVTLASTKQQQLEEQATRVAIPSGAVKGMEAAEDSQPNIADRVDPGSSTGRAIADLPTFDAISVLKDDGEGTDDATREALEELGLGGGSKPSPAMANLASPDQVDPGSSTGRAASDLPTFDAIAVLEEDAPPAPKPATVNLAAGKPDAKPKAPPPVAVSIPASDPAPKKPKEVSVSSTPPNQEPSAGQNEEYSPSTGQWEETLTIQAVKPKGHSMILPVAVIVLALLGIVGLVAAVVVVKFIL
jgi:hypothetical protein